MAKTTDPRLINIIRDYFRLSSKVGNGGTGDAIAHTPETGKLMGGSTHLQKSIEMINRINNYVRSSGTSTANKEIARAILRDLVEKIK